MGFRLIKTLKLENSLRLNLSLRLQRENCHPALKYDLQEMSFLFLTIYVYVFG